MVVEGHEQVRLAVEVVSDPLQHPEVRLRAQNVIDEVKSIASGSAEREGEGPLDPSYETKQAEQLLSLCASLIASQAPAKAYLEKKLFGISVLQQLVTQQWTDLPEPLRQRTTLYIVECCRSLCVSPEAPSYAVKSKLAVLFADMARYMSTDPKPSGAGQAPAGEFDPKGPGNAIKTYVLPEITTWPGARGVEMACLVLRWLPEGTTGTVVEALPAKRKRTLLKVLHAALPEIISFAYQALDKYYAALRQAEGQDNGGGQAQAEECKHIVEAALSLALAYAEWAPMALMHQSGIVNACGILMRDKRFREAACDVLRQQSACKLKPVFAEDGGAPNAKVVQQVSSAASTQASIEDAKAASRAVFEAFSGPCQECLASPQEYASLGLENMEFGQLLCETMVLWGKNHVKLLEGSEHLSIFLKMMMAFLQHSNANVALLTIDFWMFLVRESLLGDTSDPVEKRRLLRIPDGFVGALLDVIVSKMQKPVLDTLDDYPAEYYESVKDFHEKTAALRQRLVDISRSLAKSAPEEVFRACLGNLEKMFVHIQQNPSHKGIEIPLEAAVHLLFVASGATSAEAVGRSPALEALLAKLLNFPLAVMANRPVVIMQFVKCLESIGGHSHRIVPAVQCLLTILRSDAGQLSVPEEKHAARQQAATTVLALASREESGPALFQHVSSLMEQTQEMWNQRAIRAGERNALYEAVLVVSAGAGLEQQQKTLEWLWSETCQHFSSPQWQEKTLTDAVAFLKAIGVKQCACLANDPSFDPAKAGKERVEIYHGIQLIERLSRRLLKMKRQKNINAWLAVIPHFKWTIPVLVRILRCIHFLASPEGRKLLGACESVLDLGEVERAFILGMTPHGVSPAHYVSATAGGQFVPSASSSIGMEQDNPESLRTFLRGMRDSIYQYLGIVSQIKVDDNNLAASIGFKSFFDTMGSALNEFYALIMENLEYQDDKSTRMLIRGFICPLVKSCPQHCWRQWLGTILPPLLQHMHSRLTATWHQFLTGQRLGTARSATVQQQQIASASGVSTELGEEMLKETSMRELTREHLSLVLIVATGDEVGHTYFQHKKKGSSAAANLPSATIFQWMVAECVQAASSLLATTVASLTWPDTDTGMKSIKACRIVLGLTQKSAGELGSLQSFIAGEMLTACMSCLTLTSHADFQAEILLVLRDIITRHEVLVRPMLLGLPNINEQVLDGFHQAMRTKNSEKDQRNLVRKLLLRSGGSELKALAKQHSPGSKIPQLQSQDFGARNPKARPLLDTVGSQEQSPLQNLF